MKKVILGSLLVLSVAALSSFTNGTAAKHATVADRTQLSTADDRTQLSTADDRTQLSTADARKARVASDRTQLSTAD